MFELVIHDLKYDRRFTKTYVEYEDARKMYWKVTYSNNLLVISCNFNPSL